MASHHDPVICKRLLRPSVRIKPNPHALSVVRGTLTEHTLVNLEI